MTLELHKISSSSRFDNFSFSPPNNLQITDEETNEFLDFGDHTYNDTTFEAADDTKYDTSHH